MVHMKLCKVFNVDTWYQRETEVSRPHWSEETSDHDIWSMRFVLVKYSVGKKMTWNTQSPNRNNNKLFLDSQGWRLFPWNCRKLNIAYISWLWWDTWESNLEIRAKVSFFQHTWYNIKKVLFNVHVSQISYTCN